VFQLNWRSSGLWVGNDDTPWGYRQYKLDYFPRRDRVKGTMTNRRNSGRLLCEWFLSLRYSGRWVE
jgi:hypothetical protein